MPPRPEHDVALTEQLRGEQETNLFLQEELVEMRESLGQLELAIEDVGWRRLTVQAEHEFSRDGLTQITAVCRLMAIKNPLIKRALALRHAYVWSGDGVQVSARASSDDGDGQDVNDVIQKFWDEQSNVRTFTGDQAAEELSRALGTDGNLFIACFTAPRTGAVRVRTVPWDEITDVVTNPDDASEPWFYVRRSSTVVRQSLTSTSTTAPTITLYPALTYKPKTKPTSYLGAPVKWDAPMLHIAVNRPTINATFGVPDVYPALDWAKAYKEFLEDWARLMRSLSRFAWRATAKGNRAAKVAQQIRRPPTISVTGEPNTAGATAVMQPDQTLEAIPKSGATLNSESGRPLAAMVAAAVDVPVTMLLGDPGVTGARAVAETLDEPTKLAAENRRAILTAAYRQILDHVIDSAALAPKGRLKGTVTTDEYDQQKVVLTGDVERTLEIHWPDLSAVDPLVLVDAIVRASTTQTIPDIVVLRLLLQALGVADIDEILESVTDDDGNFIHPQVTAGQVAVDAFNRGQDPAAALGGAPPPADDSASEEPPPEG